MKILLRPQAFFVLMLFAMSAAAHRHGCHALHSCPSDSGSYVCGDKGRCDECPDNEYCKDREPRPRDLAPAQSGGDAD